MNIDWSKAPHDATHYLPETDEYWECWVKPGFSWRIKDQNRWHIDTSTFYNHLAVARPEAWQGTGLPPVGTVCEYYIDDDKWRQCEVVAHKDGYAVIWITAAHVFSARSCGLLRPLRTQEQIEAEERENQVKEIRRIMYSHLNDDRDYVANAIYDAGFRKQPKEDA